MAGGFDWPALMRIGMCSLGLRPREFWALTPAEFRLLAGAPSGGGAMDRARLDQLAQAFPDMGPAADEGGQHG